MNDVAEQIIGARVGGIGGRFARLAALAVVGEGAINAAGGERVGGDPLGAVHLGRAHEVGGHAGFHQHFALVGKAVCGGEAVLAVHQREPVAAAVFIEAGNIERALFQQAHIGGAVARLIAVFRHEFINVFKALVIAHIHSQAAVGGNGHFGAFVFEAPQRGVFARCGFGVERVDFHHPAEAVGLVGVFLAVETLVHFAPAVAVFRFADAVAFFQGADVAAGIGENIAPVFFAGEVSAPRCVAVGAVLHGAQHTLAA